MALPRLLKLLTIATGFVLLIYLLNTLVNSQLTVVDDRNGKSGNVRYRREVGLEAETEVKRAVADIYSHSELAKFADKNRHMLDDARNYRSSENWSIVSVSAIDCDICILLVDDLLALIKRDTTQEVVTEFATTACIDLKMEDERVCQAGVQEFKDELFGVLINVGYKSDEVCAMVLGSECGTPWNPDLMWNMTLPDKSKPPVVTPQPPKAGSPTLRVLHMTDFHFDTEYQEGSNAECGEPLCCRGDDRLPAPGFKGAGRYGDYRKCDTAKTAMDSMFKHLNATHDQFDYVIFTGDIPPHNVWNQSRSQQLDALQIYVSYLKKYLPNKMVFNALGNHESAPVNSFPPPYITGNDSENWLYNALVPAWGNWLPQETEPTIRWGGFYSHSPFPGLRIISLNMNMCNTGNWWLLINATDPAGMLQWFISELQSAEDKGEKVHVLGHIYPGNCLKAFSWNYYKIVNRYENTIVGQFFGHSHRDFYEVFYDEETLQRPLGVVYIPGSITTYSYLNPGYRIYEIDGDYPGSSWSVQDYTNYFLNITEANMSGRPVWQKEYSAKQAYGLRNLFPKDWNELIYRMRDDDELYASFCKHNVKSAPNDCDSCHDRNCKIDLLCKLKEGRSGDKTLCGDLH